MENSPEYIHPYRISPLSLWNAAASGMSATAILHGLDRFAKYPVPGNVRGDFTDYISRYGRVKLIKREGQLLLISDDVALITELARRKEIKVYILATLDGKTLLMDATMRGHIKHALVGVGYPAEDLAGYVAGEDLAIALREFMQTGKPFTLRHYQSEAAEVFYAGGTDHGGSGVIVLLWEAGLLQPGSPMMVWPPSKEAFFAPQRGPAAHHLDPNLLSHGGLDGYGYSSGSPTEILKKMDEAKESFVQNAGAGFLFQCGLLELGDASEKATRWEALRLTPLGRKVLARIQSSAGSKSAPRLPESSEPTLAPSDPGRIVIQPNFQILAIGPVRLDMLVQIDLFAERRKADIGVFEYHLLRDSVYSAQQAGMKVAAIQVFLQQATGTPLPQNVARTLDEWGAHRERIVFRSGVQLLQAADESLLQQLLASDKLGAYLAQPLAPTVALVKKEPTNQRNLRNPCYFQSIGQSAVANGQAAVTFPSGSQLQSLLHYIRRCCHSSIVNRRIHHV